MGKAFTLSQSQLKVLLSGCGYTAVRGILFDESPLDNEVVVNELNSMVNSGLLQPDGEAFAAIPELKRMIDVIGQAASCWYLLTNDPALPDKCLFQGDTLLCCTVRPYDGGHITLEQLVPEELVRELIDEDYLSESEYNLLPPAQKVLDFENEVFADVDFRRTLPPDSPVTLSIERDGEDGESRFLRVVDYYYCKYIVVCMDSDIRRIQYSPTNVLSYLKQMMEQ